MSVENVRRVGTDLAFSFTVDRSAGLAPLAPFLCDAGCSLSVLPASTQDACLG